MSTRVAVVGDELVAGVGDPRGMGWVGRVVGRTRTPEEIEVYTLAVPGETSTQLSARWETECNRRFGGDDDRLVVALGSADLDHGVSLARSRLNLANVLDDAANRRVAAFVVGPPPRAGVDEAALGELSRAFADVCRRRRVPYAETFEPLRAHEQWLADLAAGDGRHPGQAGYGLLAWLVLHNGWYAWIGAEDPEQS
ncbi:MAG TPA: GDSL-type esterase/lipase family protein [Actinotalea caeni]|uniref:GDSL-type esterase/lipase family protein n=1 Tax=Actinotalea caeni TaxID=1348467 RepID=UPI002B4AE839|nr:GDSL-type esterase/lipase family protein [Actinotalea caeni]HLV54247.1 GDSL-type esterase/lipase family protein [Actinotalea caeni]